MIDVKKLIAGFLILATGAASSVFIFSSINNSAQINNGASSGLALNFTTSSPSSIGNAFAPQSQPENTSGDISPDVANDPNNMTGALTSAILSGVMSANPQGPNTDSDGNQTMAPPDQTQILAQLTNDPTLKDFQPPDWDSEANSIALNISDDNSQSSTISYINAASDILNENYLQSNLQDYLSQYAMDSSNVDPSFAPLLSSSADNALNNAISLQTPKKFADYQKNLVKLLVYEKNIAELVNTAIQDPLRFSFTLEAEKSKIDLTLQNLQTELDKDTQDSFSYNDPSYNKSPYSTPLNVFAVVKNFFIVKTANAADSSADIAAAAIVATGLAIHVANMISQQAAQTTKASTQAAADAAAAIALSTGARAAGAALDATPGLSVPVVDNVAYAQRIAANTKQTAITTVNTAQTWIQKLLAYADQLALQMVKNTLIHFIQAKVLTWIQGSGAPRFVQAWATTFVNVAQAAATSYLNSQAPNVCPTFGPLLKMSLQIQANTPNTQTCTIQQPYNLAAFYNNFSSASNSLKTFYNILTPNNSFFSQLMTVQDSMQIAAGNNQNAIKAKTTSASGYTGDQVCADGTNPNGSYCVDDETGETFSAIITNGTPSCAPLETLFPSGGLCGDGSEPKVTTPGDITKSITGEGLGSSIKLTVTVKNFEDLALTLIDSLMTSIMNTAQSDINNQINGIGLTSISAITPIGTTATTTGNVGTSTVNIGTGITSAISCSPSTQTASVGSGVSISAAGGSLDTNGNPPTYSWVAPGATPATSAGSTFIGTYSSPGTYGVAVTASTGNTQAGCSVIVLAPGSPVSCSPGTQTISVGTSATISAVGGDTNSPGSQPTYTWIAGGVSSTSLTGSTFVGTYNSVTIYHVMVTASDGTSATCSVITQ